MHKLIYFFSTLFMLINFYYMLRSFFRKQQPNRLGRWTRTNVKRKVDLSNHDHCGGSLCEKPLPKKDDYDSALQSIHMYRRVPKTENK